VNLKNLKGKKKLSLNDVMEVLEQRAKKVFTPPLIENEYMNFCHFLYSCMLYQKGSPEQLAEIRKMIEFPPPFDKYHGDVELVPYRVPGLEEAIKADRESSSPQ
jgi:hypothetical protein